jgi:hypothetical protein
MDMAAAAGAAQSPSITSVATRTGRAHQLLLAHKATVEGVASALFERGQMDDSEFMRLVGASDR